MIRLGAVADLLGRPIDAHGRALAASTVPRTTSVTLESPPARPTIGFAGGPGKRQAVMAALNGGWLSGLVTDEVCARAALAAPAPKPAAGAAKKARRVAA
jgi:DNA-binding transcriptional regulator LsrR (DeoR family)